MVAAELRTSVMQRSFAAPLLGIDLKECKSLRLGEVSLEASVDQSTELKPHPLYTADGCGLT
jgi:hypothetical protein